MKDTRIVLGGQTLSPYAILERHDMANSVDTRTLAGPLFTDFRDRLREWRIVWSNMIEDSDYQIIKQLWENQFQAPYIYPILQFDTYNIYTPVKIEMDPLHDIRYNATLIDSVSVILKERNPVS